MKKVLIFVIDIDRHIDRCSFDQLCKMLKSSEITDDYHVIIIPSYINPVFEDDNKNIVVSTINNVDVTLDDIVKFVKQLQEDKHNDKN